MDKVAFLAAKQVNFWLVRSLVATHPHLTPIGAENDAALVTRNLELVLSMEFPACKFDLLLRRQGRHSVLDVAWVDGPRRAIVREITGRFGCRYGNTAGTGGELECKPPAPLQSRMTPWKLAFGWVDFLSERRRSSMAAVREALAILYKRHGGAFLELAHDPALTLERLKSVTVPVSGVEYTAQALLYRQLEHMDLPARGSLRS